MDERDNIAIVVNDGGLDGGCRKAFCRDDGWALFRPMLDVASGRRKTRAEHWKLHNALVLFNPAPVA